MRRLITPAALAMLVIVAAPAMPAPAADPAVVMRMAIDRPETAGGTYVARVTSPTIRPNSPIPRKYVDVSPPLAWTPIPGAASYVVIVEDANAGDKKLGLPFVHWLVWNIPYNAKSLPEGISGRRGAPIVEGRNRAGKIGYYGPHPPPGPPHYYHFQLFAISSLVDLPAGATREQVFGAIKGKVVGSGDLVATYASGG